MESWTDGMVEANIASGAEGAAHGVQLPPLPHEAELAPVQFRCPACRKLYAADPRDLLVDEPIFGCEACGSEFVVQPPPEVEALRASLVASVGASGGASPAAAALPAPVETPVFASIEQMVEEALAPAATQEEVPSARGQTAPAVPPAARVGDDRPLSPRSRSRMRNMQEELAARPGAKLPLASSQVGWTPCPRCLKRNAPGAQECRSCGVIMAKWRAEDHVEADVQIGGTLELARLWDAAIFAWDEEAPHLDFVAACADGERLPFASKKYGQILSVNPDDERARAMRGRIVKIASAGFDPVNASKAAATAGAGGLSLPFDLKLPRLTSIAIALSSAVLVMGILVPSLRNLAGVGASMLVATLGVRVWLKRMR